MLLKILLVVVALLIVLAVVIAMQPNDFRVTRSTAISAPALVVFEQVNDLVKWNAWSPWAKLDPTAKYTFEGPPSGNGAVIRWAGNSNVGEGSMTITDSRPNELVQFRLDFLKPFNGTNTAEFTFKTEGNQTVVTWSMFGQANFISKAMGLFMNCEKMIGGQFEQGLADMKSIAEATAAR